MYDPMDNRGVPVSKGVPPAVRYAAAVGLVFIFAMGFLTVFDADYGHKWPAASVLRLPLK